MRKSIKNILIVVAVFIAIALFGFIGSTTSTPKQADPEAVKKTLQMLINGNDAKILELQDEIKKAQASSDCLKLEIASYKREGFQEILNRC